MKMSAADEERRETEREKGVLIFFHKLSTGCRCIDIFQIHFFFLSSRSLVCSSFFALDSEWLLSVVLEHLSVAENQTADSAARPRNTEVVSSQGEAYRAHLL